MTRLVSDEAISAALHFLATFTEESAAARGMRVRCEFKRKRVRARLIRASNEATVGGREAWAEDHDEYAASCEAEADAVERDEWFRAEKNKAETIVACWQTENANHRAGGSFR